MMTTTRAATSRMTIKQRAVQTTTLEIARPDDFDRLEGRFYAERYVLPEELRYTKQQSDIMFGRIHSALRDQLEYPYKVFTHDSLDGQRRWVVYALMPRGAQATPVTLPWLARGGELPHRTVPFTQVPFHITLKLLQIALFRGSTSTRFVGRDECYTYAGPDGRNFYSCVRVELKGARETHETDPIHTFQVIPHATRFAPADLTKARPWDTLYGKRAAGDRFYFLQLKSGQAERESTLYREVRWPDRRAHVKYHDPQDLDAGRGKILNDFVQEFLAYLRELGIEGVPRRRTLAQFKTPNHLRLDFTRLGAIGVYDNRLNRDMYPLPAYVDLFARLRPDVSFVPIVRLEDAPVGGALALLDAAAIDFMEGGVLAGQEDPYPPLYRSTPHIPKQSLMINFTDANALAGRDYLAYPFPEREQVDDLTLRLETALNELYLKSAIAHGYGRVPLPLVSDERSYVRKRRESGETYTTALWFAEGQLRFADLGDPIAREAFIRMAAQWGVDYLARLEEFSAMCGRDEEPREFDLILGPDLFVVIEDAEERVLYAYEEIQRRRSERSRLRSIDEFKLSRHYDVLKSADMLSLELLEEQVRQGVSGSAAGALRRANSSSAVARSRVFYEQLVEYDHLLDEIAVTHPTISLDELIREAWMSDIARIFGSERAEGKAHGRALLRKYHKIGLYHSERSDDVQLSQGIWHDDTGAFVVGSTTAMNSRGQENAHLIRRFRVLQGELRFDRDEFLAAMAVKFVRPRQYTVLPYHFHLIDVYVEHVGRYM